MDLCHLKNSELQKKFQKYKGRVVQGGDIVKEDSENHAVISEQGASASHMTAAKISDAGCSGQASGVVSAHTQIKMKDAPEHLRLSGTDCPKNWIRIPKTRRSQLGNLLTIQ